MLRSFHKIGTKLITLDVTNTIVQVKGGVGGMYKQVAADLKLDDLSDTSVKCINATFKNSFLQHWLKHPNFGFGSMQAYEWWRNVTMDTLESFTLGADQRQLTEFANALYDAFSTGQAYDVMPEATDTLEKLSEKVEIVVVTNNDSRIRKVLEELFPHVSFKKMLISHEQGICKPDERIFLEALKSTNLRSMDQAVHIGDSYSKDYLPATSIGMRAILLSPSLTDSHTQYPLTSQISNIGQVLDFL